MAIGSVAVGGVLSVLTLVAGIGGAIG
jgi:hypothetical protein